MSYYRIINQYSTVDPNNSSTVNLAAGGTFTGIPTSTIGVNGIQPTLKTDQNCNLYVEQSSDATNWDIIDSYYYNKMVNNFGVTVQRVQAYYRFRVENLNTTTATSYFRLNAVLVPIGNAFPRSLDEQGHLQRTADGFNDDFGFSGEFTPMRDIKSCLPFRMVGTTYDTTADSNFWTTSSTGTGASATVASSKGTVISGTSTSGYGQITSVRSARTGSYAMQFRGAFRVDATGIANNTRRWGAYTVSTNTPQNGVYFEYDSTGLAIVTCRDTTEAQIYSGSFNGDISEYKMDTNVHAYEIIYERIGTWFYVDNVLIHESVPTTLPLFFGGSFPVTFASVNSASGNTSATLECWNSAIIKLGKEQTQTTSKFITVGNSTTSITLCKASSGYLHSMVLNLIRSTGNINIVIYDNTTNSGTILFDSGTLNASQPIPQSIRFMYPFHTGLTCSVVTSNNATVNLLLVYE